MHSVRLAITIATLNGAIAVLPGLNLSPELFAILNSFLGTLVAIARVIRQPSLTPDAPAGDTAEESQQ